MATMPPSSPIAPIHKPVPLPQYLAIAKLTPQKIRALPINQQTLAENVMRARKDGDRRSKRFLMQWAKRLPEGQEKRILMQIVGESSGK